MNSITARLRYRTQQFCGYVSAASYPVVDQLLRSSLTRDEWPLVARMDAGDRIHVLAVERKVAAGGGGTDVRKAALLHDIGKVSSESRVRLVHRVLVVLLGRCAPSILRRLSDSSGPSWTRGFFLARAHPQLGAALARDAGANERVCWLIAHHHDENVTDPDLALLIAADHESIR